MELSLDSHVAITGAYFKSRELGMADGPTVPPHVEQSVAAIAELHRAHYRKAGPGQRWVSAATAAVARPWILVLLVVATVGWIGLNEMLTRAGDPAPDPYPYPLLALTVSTGGVLLAAMILIVQRHDDELATKRDQLTLELAILAEQKTAKMIALLEEFRRSAPDVEDRLDAVADALAEPADPNAVVSAIEAAHDDRHA